MRPSSKALWERRRIMFIGGSAKSKMLKKQSFLAPTSLVSLVSNQLEVKTMEYIYAAMLIHKAGGKVEEPTVKKVLEAAGVKADDARIKALVASLEGVNIDEAVKKAATAPVAAAPAAAPAGKEEKKKAEKPKEDEKKKEAQAAAGLGALFG